MARTKVFISSAMDELEYEREIATKVIKELNLEPSVFEGFPAMSKTLEDAYIDEIKDCDIFVLILWKTLRTAVEREYYEAIRGNKSILIFVKMLKEGESREEELNEFLGSIRRNGEKGTDVAHVRFYKHYRSLADLEEGLRNGIISEINRWLARTIMMTHTRKEMYELGTNIIVSAQRRLCITQRTPSLFFGARPYDAPEKEKVSYEMNFYDALNDWIDRAIEDEERECIYLYDVQDTKAEMKKHRLQEPISEIITTLKEKERRSRHRIRISSALSRHSGPITVGDNWFAIWVMGEDNAVCISYINEQVSDALYSVLSQLGSKITSAEDLKAELGIE
jgi:hypothetical protein